MWVFVRQRLSGRNDRARTVKTDYNASSIKGRNLTLTGIELKKGRRYYLLLCDRVSMLFFRLSFFQGIELEHRHRQYGLNKQLVSKEFERLSKGLSKISMLNE